MDTDELLLEPNSDANEALTRRIRTIYKEVDGGLSIFFSKSSIIDREEDSEVLAGCVFENKGKSYFLKAGTDYIHASHRPKL